MSREKDSDEKQSVKPPPFSGFAMTDNISLSIDDGGEEVTRRIGGTPSFNPSFNHNVSSTTIAPPSVSSSLNNSIFNSDPGSSIETAIRKGDFHTEPRSQKFRWLLEQAPILPSFHPLEQTAAFIPNTNASVISERISDVLRDRSIEVRYDDSNAEASCVTSEGVDFRVFLYRGQKEYSHGIIVEVQRRFGTSIKFYSDVKAILDAAVGKKADPQGLQNLDFLPKADEDDFKPNASASLSMVSKMMNHSGSDSQYLALQTLATLTDRSKVGIVTARCVAKELILPENEVGKKVAGIILEGNQGNDDHFGLQSMSLIILANVLGSVSGNIPNDLQSQLVPVLREKLRNAEVSPREAHIASRCIEHLYTRKIDDSLIEALEMAAQVGNAKHIGLMRQAELCLRKAGAR